MDLKSVIYDILVEEVRNKKLLNTLFQKWKQEPGNEDLSLEDVEWAFTQFMGGTDNDGNNIQGVRNKLSLKKQEVKNFLFKYNGDYGRPKFEPAKIGDINSYSWNQMLSILAQYGQKLQNRGKKIEHFIDNPSIPKSEYVEESKKLWYGDKFKVFDDGKGLRVYKPESQKDSISFGFYQKHIAKTEFPNETTNKWCVTSYPSGSVGDTMSNLWQSYRDRNKLSFYFVIDDTKSKDSKYHMSALQRMGEPNGDFVFKITSVKNDGDTPIKLNDPLNQDKSLAHIYPQLFESDEWSVMEELTYSEFNEAEEMDVRTDKLTRLLDQITEDPGEYDFVIQDPDVKEAYISRGRELHKVRSYQSLNDTQLRLYVETHITQNVDDTFKSYEIFKYLITETSSDFRNYLISRLRSVGSSVADIFTNMINKNYDRLYWSKQSEAIIIVESIKDRGLVGIFNGEQGDWLEHDGIKYEPFYREMESEMLLGYFDFDKSGNEKPADQGQEEPETEIAEGAADSPVYNIRIYSLNSNVNDPKNFYVLDSMDGSASVSIFSHKTWKSIAEPVFVEMGSEDPSKDYGDVESRFRKDISEKGGY